MSRYIGVLSRRNANAYAAASTQPRCTSAMVGALEAPTSHGARAHQKPGEVRSSRAAPHAQLALLLGGGARPIRDDPAMWTVTTVGDLPDDHESRRHAESAAAWDDYAGRILELEINGFTCVGEQANQYGRRWRCSLSRGVEQMTVTIERTG